MKYGVVIGSHTALSVCQQNGPGIIRKSSTMGAGSTAFKAKSSTLGFFFLFDFTHSDLLANYVLRFTTTAHQSEQPLSKAEDVEKHYQAHQRHYKAASHLIPCPLPFTQITLKVKAACIRHADYLGTICQHTLLHDSPWLTLIRKFILT